MAEAQRFGYRWDMERCRTVTLVEMATGMVDRVNRALEPWSLTFASYQVLWQMGPEARSHKSLADAAHCAPSNITRLVSKLEALGYVTRHTPESDRRTVLTSLTEEGQAALAGANAALDALLPDLEAEVVQTAKVLEQIRGA